MSWIIYKHTCTGNGKVYIGQSKYSWQRINDRWQSGHGYGEKTRLGLAIRKHGWENFKHELVEDNIESQEEANEREIYWIRYYNSFSEGYNCTIGGKNIPKELVYKVKVYCKETNCIYESIIDASHKLDISYSIINRQLKTGHYYRSDKYRFCLASEKDTFNPKDYIVQRDFESIKRDIICVETKEIFDSIVECSKKTGISTQNLSQNCCINHRSAHGMHFAYLEEYDENWKPALNYDTKRREKSSTLKKEIYCYQTNKFYPSATVCARELGLPIRSVSRCAKKDGDLIATHGFNFCYKNDYYEGWKPREKKKTTYICSDKTREKMRINSPRCKKVLCIETGNVYPSASEAARNLGISKDLISNVCSNKPHCKTAGGYHWKYIE